MILKRLVLEARDLPDAWFQLIYNVFDDKYSRYHIIHQGSFPGSYRWEYDWVDFHITHPSKRPLLPDMPPNKKIPLPVPGGMADVEKYFAEKILGNVRSQKEEYTYGERILLSVDQIIERYKKGGFWNNQCVIQIARPEDLNLKDPPCCRHIDTRIVDGAIHFFPYFRSWELYAGLPKNLAAFVLLNEYMADGIGVAPGEMICTSKGLHIYKYAETLIEMRTNLTKPETESKK